MQKIESKNAPKPIGPYSQGIKMNSGTGMLFVSGQIPIDPETGKLVEGDIRDQARQVFMNLLGVLHEGGSSAEQVIKVEIFLKNLRRDFSILNEEYGKVFTGPIYPARQVIEVSELPLGSEIELSCIAIVEEK